ncbi:MAG: PDZ domain-containing protein, partial [Akkermansiaceae bacterium]|nr:PDZ domain-containing protein [Akkermansiaceae bacterium]
MKHLRHSLIPLGLTALFTAPAIAIEPPDDTSPPPAVPAAEQPAAPARQEAEAEAPAAAYLGIGAAAVPDALAAHLNLKPEEGVVIRLLDPNGPAAKAGLAEHDVITRIGGQAVSSHAELAAQIQQHQPGAEIAIDFIHQCKPATKTLTLAPRPDGMAADPAPNHLDDLMLRGMPKGQADRIRKAIERQLRAFGADELPPLGDLADPDMNKEMREMQKRMNDALKQQGIGGGIKIQGGATVRIADGEGSVELNSKDGGKEATVRDQEGKKIWSGPWDTEQDKGAAPPEVPARLGKLNLDENFMGSGLRLRLGR